MALDRDRLDGDGTTTVSAAAQVRAEAGGRFDAAISEIVAAAEAMVGPLRAGAVLSCLGTGVSSADAAHVAVEFLHPVIVGKRSIPARAFDPSRERAEHGQDPHAGVVMGLRLDNGTATVQALSSARAAGCLTIDVHAGSNGAGADHAADHAIDARADHPLVAREHQVTAYHLLWELVHELLDAGNSTDQEAPDDLGSLYPFLFDNDRADGDLIEHATRSARSKIDEIARLRGDVLAQHATELVAAAAAVRRAVHAGGRVWTFGNGGSSTDARALAHVLRNPTTGSPAQGSPAQGRPVDSVPIHAAALTDDVATLTALANDVSFDVVFARMLRSLARPGDVAVGLSTSGGSANVLAGLDAARSLDMTTVGFAGYDGGDMAHLEALDHLFVVPSSSVHRIQEAQTTLLHVLVELVRSPGP